MDLKASLAHRKYEMRMAAASRWENGNRIADATLADMVNSRSLGASESKRTIAPQTFEIARKQAARYKALLERRIGDTLDWEDHAPNAEAERAGVPVARIVVLNPSGRVDDGIATGFLIYPGLLVTNWHVFPDKTLTQNCAAQFRFQSKDDESIDSGAIFAIDSSAFYLSDEALDFAIVGLCATPCIGQGALEEYGTIVLRSTKSRYVIGDPINVIQHPDGKPKRWATSNNGVAVAPRENDIFLTYLADTLEGSSGSPAFNRNWQLEAIHHSGVPLLRNGKIVLRGGGFWSEGVPDNEIVWIANEGVQISAVCQHLRSLRVTDPSMQELIASVLSHVDAPATIAPETAQRDRNWLTVASSPANATPMPTSPISIVINGSVTFNLNTHDHASPEDNARPPMLQPTNHPKETAFGRNELDSTDVPRASTTTWTPVGLEKRLRFDSDYVHRPGYSPTFLDGFDVPLPIAPQAEVLKRGSNPFVLDYHHYSLVMHKKRRLAMWTAANINYSPDLRRKSRQEFGADTWKPDPRIPIENQIEDTEFYKPAKKFDRGHLVRREDVAWGSDPDDEEFGNSDSFHWTNCTPQHEHFNRAVEGYIGLWGMLENHITSQASFVNHKYILFSGPLLDAGDPSRDFGSGSEIQVPIVFWKVVVAVEDVSDRPILRAYAFLLDQTEAIDRYGWEGRFSAGRFREQQVSLATLSSRTRVTFDSSLNAADPLADGHSESRPRTLISLSDIRLK